jgi:hypothetical protein
MDTEIEDRGREIAIELMLKALFGAIEHLNPRFSGDCVSAALADSAALLSKRFGPRAAEVRRAAVAVIDRVLAP